MDLARMNLKTLRLSLSTTASLETDHGWSLWTSRERIDTHAQLVAQFGVAFMSETYVER